MRVKWTNRSALELESVLSYIAKDNKEAGQKLIEHITDDVHSILAVNPKLGRMGQVEGTREFVVHKSYIVVYRLKSETLEILSIWHTARQKPSTFL